MITEGRFIWMQPHEWHAEYRRNFEGWPTDFRLPVGSLWGDEA